MYLIVSVSFNFHFQGYHPLVKINTTKSLSALFETGKRNSFLCLSQGDRCGHQCPSYKAVDESKEDEVAAC